MQNAHMSVLESKITTLLEQFDTLKKDNIKLKSQQLVWRQEREKLVKQNDLARQKIGIMIEKLRAMENSDE
ncbi:TIGR02449 family protein [Marinicellulosiphila megalodicopiae]|uniref:TIGR02449 family protein n=1 Tax=Marinicellulosiphila megalodicopiae TaxID=2724896 RepID=UPI003BB037B8